MPYKYEHKPKVRFVYIIAYDRLGGTELERLSYKDLPMRLAIKYGWYFKYRHALLQVKYPKGYIETHHHNVVPEGRSLERIEEERKKRERTTCKRMITKITNALTEYENIENKTLFPNLNDENYIKANKKLSEYKLKLEKLSA